MAVEKRSAGLTVNSNTTGGTVQCEATIPTALVLPNGTSTAPSFYFANSSTFGLASVSSTSFGIAAPAGWAETFTSAGFNEILSGGCFAWSSSATNAGAAKQTGVCSPAPALMVVGSGPAGNTTGLVKTSQALAVTGANFTTSATTLATAGVITGLNFSGPASYASNWNFHCDIVYSQATAAAADLFGVVIVGTAPTIMSVAGEVNTTQTSASQVDSNAAGITATATAVTATPSAFGAIGTTADMFTAHFWGTAS